MQRFSTGFHSLVAPGATGIRDIVCFVCEINTALNMCEIEGQCQRELVFVSLLVVNLRRLRHAVVVRLHCALCPQRCCLDWERERAVAGARIVVSV